MKYLFQSFILFALANKVANHQSEYDYYSDNDTCIASLRDTLLLDVHSELSSTLIHDDSYHGHLTLLKVEIVPAFCTINFQFFGIIAYGSK